jgi:hypothetical protein
LLERPKSREETPKEGDDSEREPFTTALQQYTLRRTKSKRADLFVEAFPRFLPAMAAKLPFQSWSVAGMPNLAKNTNCSIAYANQDIGWAWGKRRSDGVLRLHLPRPDVGADK